MSYENFAILKHGTSSLQAIYGQPWTESSVNFFIDQHEILRNEGFMTAEVSSGAFVEGLDYIQRIGRLAGDFTDDEITGFGTDGQIVRWKEAAGPVGIPVQQVLVTHKEIHDAKEGAKIVKTIQGLAQKDVLAVINENPAADDSELKEMEEGGDNDWMAADVAITTGATHLVLLTDVDGFKVGGEVLDEIKVADIPEMLQYCAAIGIDGIAEDKRSKGGMKSKLLAGGKAANAGVEVVIGRAFSHISKLVEGEAGTRVVQ